MERFRPSQPKNRAEALSQEEQTTHELRQKAQQLWEQYDNGSDSAGLMQEVMRLSAKRETQPLATELSNMYRDAVDRSNEFKKAA